MRVRAFGAIVGARHASPVKYAFGVYSVNALFTSYHEKIAHNANIHVMIRRARHASPANTEEEYMQWVSRCKGLLSVVVGNMKSAITHFANLHNIGFAWQRSYHEHIIRDTDDFNRIAEYIRMNPLRWAEDEYNKP